jgi:MoxR-like ATPase
MVRVDGSPLAVAAVAARVVVPSCPRVVRSGSGARHARHLQEERTSVGTQLSSAADTALVQGVTEQVRRRVVGQEYMVERLLVSLLTGGHVLLEGVPGLAKTLTVRTLAESIHTTFQRIQFTPDLLPADVLGTQVYDQSTGQFVVKRGPIFANVILADEINRAPAKVQAALLEAMQEKQVTIGGTTFPLDEPFLVLATQNPIEQEGTYPLPEAQVDRFMLKLRVGYPSRDEEKEIMRRMASGVPITVEPIATPEAIMAARRRVAELYVDERIVDYIVDIVHATRAPREAGLAELAPLIEFGASPRATIALAQASRAHAFLRGRTFVTPDDVKAIAPDVLRHRVLTTYEAEAEEVSSDDVVARILGAVETP